jgi:hypothetical protein
MVVGICNGHEHVRPLTAGSLCDLLSGWLCLGALFKVNTTLTLTICGGAAELRKKGKPKRPSIKTLFGEYCVKHIVTHMDARKCMCT